MIFFEILHKIISFGLNLILRLSLYYPEVQISLLNAEQWRNLRSRFECRKYALDDWELCCLAINAEKSWGQNWAQLHCFTKALQ